MIWFYRLQQRLAITRNEAVAILTLAVLLLVGLLVRHVQQQPPEVEAGTYAAVDSQFAANSHVVPGANHSAVSTGEEPTALRGWGRQPSPLNLNVASETELRQLPGIGPALSQRITAHREEYGSFATVSELTRVRGIGDKTLERLEPLIHVQSDTTTADVQASRD